MSKRSLNRRSFLRSAGKTAATISTFVAMPSIVPHTVFGQTSPNDKLTVGIIGLGSRGRDHLQAAIRNENIHIAALADLDFYMLKDGLDYCDTFTLDDNRVYTKRVAGWQQVRQPTPSGGAEPYLDYRKLLERNDIDAVMIAIPDHWHAKAYIDALDAGKHVYGEKPLTQTIAQGRKVVNKVKETGKVFQCGFQQRSHFNFLRACELVANGYLGDIKEFLIDVRGTPFVEPVPNTLVPGGLNHDMWCGPTELIPYNPMRSHIHFRYYFEYAGGYVTDLGAHHADIVLMALGRQHTGPKKIEGTAKRAKGQYNTFSEYRLSCIYEDGIKITFTSKQGFDMTIYGSKGELFVNRDRMESKPGDILSAPISSTDKKFVSDEMRSVTGDTYHLSTGMHVQNWYEAIRTGSQPVSDVESAHRSTSVCHLANICGLVGRTLEWDTEKEIFIGDKDANALLDIEQRAPYNV
jgi:predicted dehydrogenase